MTTDIVNVNCSCDNKFGVVIRGMDVGRMRKVRCSECKKEFMLEFIEMELPDGDQCPERGDNMRPLESEAE